MIALALAAVALAAPAPERCTPIGHPVALSDARTAPEHTYHLRPDTARVLPYGVASATETHAYVDGAKTRQWRCERRHGVDIFDAWTRAGSTRIVATWDGRTVRAHGARVTFGVWA